MGSTGNVSHAVLCKALARLAAPVGRQETGSVSNGWQGSIGWESEGKAGSVV
jgi:hypothetical protein